MKNLFHVLPTDFFKPLTSKYKMEEYFEADDNEMTFDEQTYIREEAEYQGIISQIHASLQNQDLYTKPYELIIKGVKENTERLISELKKLNVSIKRHMDKQTNEMSASEIIDHFLSTIRSRRG